MDIIIIRVSLFVIRLSMFAGSITEKTDSGRDRFRNLSTLRDK
jgi:hypothetical protein